MAEFQSFAALLGPKPAAPATLAAPLVPKMPPPPPPAQIAQPTPAAPAPARPAVPAQLTADPQVQQILVSFLGDLGRIRARALELFEAECETMLAALAEDVLGRELRIAPVDLLQIMRKLRGQYNGEMKVKIAGQDQRLFVDRADVEIDNSLVPGDLVVETPEGTIDLKIGSRVAAMLAARRVEA